MVCWKVVSMTQNRHSKPLTLGAVYSACLCGEDALLDGAPTPCSRCTCLYTVASSRGTHNGVNRFVWAIMFATRLCGASYIVAFWMVRPLSQALQLWLFHTLDTPQIFVCFPASVERAFRMDRGRYPWGRSLAVRFTTQTKLLVYSQIPQKTLTRNNSRSQPQWVQVYWDSL